MINVGFWLLFPGLNEDLTTIFIGQPLPAGPPVLEPEQQAQLGALAVPAALDRDGKRASLTFVEGHLQSVGRLSGDAAVDYDGLITGGR
ncbi:MAG: hypothetical protein M3N95_02425 [Actinomycetota bacterium]|nr:hypothetical protein [Actinomycetota bacterium]